MSARQRISALATVLALLLPRLGAAQDSRLERLDPTLRSQVAGLIDSVRAEGLPIEPLVDRALEGASKRAPSALITGALRRLAADLGRARAVLGSELPAGELAAAADALRAGAEPDVLVRLRDALGHRRLAVPLSVTADLAARGVPADTAAGIVIALARSVTDGQLLALQRNVERDIALGAAPLAAAGGLLSADGLEAAAPTPGALDPTTTQARPQTTPRKP
ncbi:MAG TPA: hypothetical protein VD793_10220 [Gemmatimonadales bacterium]|nr:hypothetical protein [Gemmatimonadales bacterium]